MYSSGILILTTHVSRLCSADVIKQILNSASKIVDTNLYVHLENSSSKKIDFLSHLGTSTRNYSNVFVGLKEKCNPSSNQYPDDKWQCSTDVLTFVSRFYSQAFYQCKHLNISILTHNIGHQYLLKRHHYLRRWVVNTCIY